MPVYIQVNTAYHFCLLSKKYDIICHKNHKNELYLMVLLRLMRVPKKSFFRGRHCHLDAKRLFDPVGTTFRLRLLSTYAVLTDDISSSNKVSYHQTLTQG